MRTGVAAFDSGLDRSASTDVLPSSVASTASLDNSTCFNRFDGVKLLIVPSGDRALAIGVPCCSRFFHFRIVSCCLPYSYLLRNTPVVSWLACFPLVLLQRLTQGCTGLFNVAVNRNE
jgi:hypothetical protein